MSNIMIRAENISKYYRLGTLGSGRLREDLKNWWKGRETGERLPALKNISFEVEQGEVLGFLGKNGAGKSNGNLDLHRNYLLEFLPK